MEVLVKQNPPSHFSFHRALLLTARESWTWSLALRAPRRASHKKLGILALCSKHAAWSEIRVSKKVYTAVMNAVFCALTPAINYNYLHVNLYQRCLLAGDVLSS
ncbi:hypothetical protein KIN20_011124 [Parelaphostrongylus tenuis]|uniref:Uncharacterized protein n=1 Tax=Parelaphostrongylus tenuis TaxID=148309 RepID=A0AAD5QM90_PARTN|nr:hypothetical protein KIN20_011124 [Parelaphostrongylus tenuis]